MSTISLKNVKLGDSPDPSKNFVISVPAVADGTLTIKRESGIIGPADFASDAAAATGGVPIGGIYRTGSILKVRVV